MKSATLDAINQLERIVDVYESVPEGWFTCQDYCEAHGVSFTRAKVRLGQLVRAGVAEVRRVRIRGKKPTDIYRPIKRRKP